MIKKVILFLFISWFSHANAQVISKDTLNLAQKAIESKDLKGANILLSKFNQNYNNQYGIELQAQVLYWLKKFDDAAALYEIGISSFQNYHILKLEYGRMLFQLGKIEKSKTYIQAYLNFDKSNIEAKILLANIYFYQGQIRKSKNELFEISKTANNNKEVIELNDKIKDNTSPYLKLGSTFYSDNQPLNKMNANIEMGIYSYWLFSPQIKVNTTNIESDRSLNTSQYSIGNKVYFFPSKTSIELETGIFNNIQKQFNTWKVSITQKMSSNANLTYITENMPYQYTLSSLKNPFTYNNSELSFNYNKQEKMMGKLAYITNAFKDGNAINTYYAWLLVKLTKSSLIDVHLGYAYAFSNADKNNFVPKFTITASDINKQIEGIYDPYFTPYNQSIHSGIISFKLPITSNFYISSKISAGFLANAEQPVLTVIRSNNIISTYKNYVPIYYNPMEIDNEIGLKMNKQLNIDLSHQYKKTIFYSYNSINLNLKYQFK